MAGDVADQEGGSQPKSHVIQGKDLVFYSKSSENLPEILN